MKERILAVLITALAIPLAAHAQNNQGASFLEGEAQEVIIKVRTAEGKIKWYRVKPNGSRKELEMKPGDRFEFLYEDAVDLNAVTVKPKAK